VGGSAGSGAREKAAASAAGIATRSTQIVVITISKLPNGRATRAAQTRTPPVNGRHTRDSRNRLPAHAASNASTAAPVIMKSE